MRISDWSSDVCSSDLESQNATLIGMEYIITHEQYNSLPDREKPNWHYHKIELVPNRADTKFPELNAQQTQSEMMKAMDTYEQEIIKWNTNRSEERREGKESDRTCITRWSSYHK